MGFLVTASRTITRFTPTPTPIGASVLARHATGLSLPRSFTAFGADTAPGGGTVYGARSTTPRRTRGTTDAWGRPVVWWEDFAHSGDSLQAGLNRTATAYPSASYPNGVHVSLPNGVFTWSGFAIGNKIGLQIGGGYGGTTHAISGSGSGTHLYMQPHTASGASIALVPNQSTGSTNPLFQILFTGVSNPCVENLTLDYTDQPVNSASSTSPTRPVLWNGVYFSSCSNDGAHPNFSDVWATAFSNGDNTANPGETFSLDGNHTDGITRDHCTFDGAVSAYQAAIPGNTTAAGTKVSSTLVGYNNSTGSDDSYCVDVNSGYGHATSNYQMHGAITHDHCIAYGNAKAPWNHERSYGPSDTVITFQNCRQYGNTQEQINFVGDHGDAVMNIHDHAYGSATIAPSTGGPMKLYMPAYYYFPIVAGTTHGPPSQQLMSNVHYYNAGTLDDHFMFNTATDPAGHTGYFA